MNKPSIFSNRRTAGVNRVSFTNGGLFKAPTTIADTLLLIVQKATNKAAEQEAVSELKPENNNRKNELSHIHIDPDLLKKVQDFCNGDPAKIGEVIKAAKEKNILKHPAIQDVINFLSSENDSTHGNSR